MKDEIHSLLMKRVEKAIGGRMSAFMDAALCDRILVALEGREVRLRVNDGAPTPTLGGTATGGASIPRDLP